MLSGQLQRRTYRTGDMKEYPNKKTDDPYNEGGAPKNYMANNHGGLVCMWCMVIKWCTLSRWAWRPQFVARGYCKTALKAMATGVHMTFAYGGSGAGCPWSRCLESTGEDTWLNSRFAEAIVKGVQGAVLTETEGNASCMKHFAALWHGGNTGCGVCADAACVFTVKSSV